MNRKRTEIGREAFEKAKAAFEKMKDCTDEKQLEQLKKEYDEKI